MPLTVTKLRANIYKVLDSVLDTGGSVEVQRRGKRLKISPVKPPSKLQNLIPRPGVLAGKPEDIVHLDWSREWKP